MILSGIKARATEEATPGRWLWLAGRVYEYFLVLVAGVLYLCGLRSAAQVTFGLSVGIFCAVLLLRAIGIWLRSSRPD
jgi:hypothetical protein